MGVSESRDVSWAEDAPLHDVIRRGLNRKRYNEAGCDFVEKGIADVGLRCQQDPCFVPKDKAFLRTNALALIAAINMSGIRPDLLYCIFPLVRGVYINANPRSHQSCFLPALLHSGDDTDEVNYPREVREARKRVRDLCIKRLLPRRRKGITVYPLNAGSYFAKPYGLIHGVGDIEFQPPPTNPRPTWNADASSLTCAEGWHVGTFQVYKSAILFSRHGYDVSVEDYRRFKNLIVHGATRLAEGTSVMDRATCVRCGKNKRRPKLMQCGRCRKVFYCSYRCQAKHWTVHETSCVLDTEDIMGVYNATNLPEGGSSPTGSRRRIDLEYLRHLDNLYHTSGDQFINPLP